MMRHVFGSLLFCCAVSLAACGGSGGVNIPPNAAPTQAPPLSLLPVNNAATSSLATGASVTVDTSLFPPTQVSVAHDPAALETPAAPQWGVASGVLSVTFAQPFAAASPSSRQDSATTAMVLSMPFQAAQSTAIASADAPTVAISYADGSVERVLLQGTIDTNADTVTVSVPKAILGNATGIKLYLSTDGASTPVIQTGPRYWNGSSWSTTGSIKPGLKTLVLIHGVFSSVETAFPCAGSIGTAGGYQQILGFDYNWTQPPQTEGPLFASFLNTILGSGVASIDVEGHSYGTLITLQAVPSVAKSVKNVVLLDGPLPFEGTPLAKSWLMRTILGIVAKYTIGTPSEIDAAFKSGMVASTGTNSPELISIQSAISAIPYPKPNFFATGGTVEYPEEAYFYPVLYWYITYPWDGVVETIASLSKDIPSLTGQTFPLQHTQIECSPSVIQWVGQNVNPG